jgi:DedD protein
MTDEGLREIQLNGKQLVFLFMSATVVSVVIFLSGVMVGRGVRARQGADAVAVAAEVPADPTAGTQSISSPVVTGRTTGAPLSSQETLTYAERLGTMDPPPETLKEAPPPARPSTQASGWDWSKSASERPMAAEPSAARAPTTPTSKPTPRAIDAGAAAATEARGPGFVVQVAAVTERREADAIARKLSAKGYPAFVTTPVGAAHVFRVRVGTYKSRQEAEAIAARLEKEDQFKPWITR